MLIHTDFGHDPDDCIAISYLIEHGHITATTPTDKQIFSLIGIDDVNNM